MTERLEVGFSKSQSSNGESRSATPYELHYYGDQKFLKVVVQGLLPRDEFAEAVRRITRSEDYPPDIPVLWDTRLAEMPAVDSKFERDLIEIRKTFPERGKAKIAILVSENVAFGMGRMYEMLSSSLPQRIMVFRQYEEAVKWLLDITQ